MSAAYGLREERAVKWQSLVIWADMAGYTQLKLFELGTKRREIRCRIPLCPEARLRAGPLLLKNPWCGSVTNEASRMSRTQSRSHVDDVHLMMFTWFAFFPTDFRAKERLLAVYSDANGREASRTQHPPPAAPATVSAVVILLKMFAPNHFGLSANNNEIYAITWKWVRWVDFSPAVSSCISKLSYHCIFVNVLVLYQNEFSPKKTITCCW